MGEMDYTKMDMKKYPWVLWLVVRREKIISKNFWYVRMANCMEIQIFDLCVSIGLPWIPHVLEGKIRDYSNLDTAMETNTANIIQKFSFPIGSYTKFYTSEKQSQ